MAQLQLDIEYETIGARWFESKSLYPISAKSILRSFTLSNPLLSLVYSDEYRPGQRRMISYQWNHLPRIASFTKWPSHRVMPVSCHSYLNNGRARAAPCLIRELLFRANFNAGVGYSACRYGGAAYSLSRLGAGAGKRICRSPLSGA